MRLLFTSTPLFGHFMPMLALIDAAMQAGHEVVVAATGTAALEALEHQSFDLVLMDMQMPEMGGLEATIAVRSANERMRAASTSRSSR